MYVYGSMLALIVVAGLTLLAAGPSGMRMVLGVVVPYTGFAVLLAGICYRVTRWALTPVPFRIPTTCGQQCSLPWLNHARLDNPATTSGVVGRMLLEVLCFRSLFRNNRAELYENRLVFGENKYLWLGAIAFHYSFLIILLRHLRLVLQPVPNFVLFLQRADGFFQISTPEVYATDILILAALVYLLLRRLRDPFLRYISLFTDYFALFLLLGIALTGVLMRYFVKTDVAAVKQLALGLATFTPNVPPETGRLFFVHLLLVSLLAAYFPFSKLMHMGGVFLNPTRNLANTTRIRRHINPWNYPVKTHTFAEWQEEFRDKLVAAGMALEAPSPGATDGQGTPEAEHARAAVTNRT